VKSLKSDFKVIVIFNKVNLAAVTPVNRFYNEGIIESAEIIKAVLIPF
jgi:hypothetical protein